MKYTMKSPCAECPFRRDRPGFLRRARVQSIADGLLAEGETCQPFKCHKTIGMGEDAQHCAGALIVLEKMNRPHLGMLTGRMLSEYDGHPDVGHPHVFHNMKQFVEHHARQLPGQQIGMTGGFVRKHVEELPDEPNWRPVGK